MRNKEQKKADDKYRMDMMRKKQSAVTMRN